ncbi:MAG: porin family protein [Limnohabitans sp.]|jgi:opacity protein-like surface antigen
MKTSHRTLIATLILSAGAMANAQSQRPMENGYYAEVGYSPIELSGAGGGAKPDALRFLVGYDINPNLGVEALYTTTVTKESHVGYDASMSAFGLLLKPKLALTPNTEIFARVGAIRADITASANGARTGTDFAYGLGIQTKFSDAMHVQLDYMHSYDRDNVSAKGYTVSIGKRF